MRRDLDRRIRVATAAALLAPAMLLIPAAAHATTSHLPAATSDEPEGQWWQYKEPSETATGQSGEQQPRTAKSDDETDADDDAVQEPGATRRPSQDAAADQPNRRSLPDESGDAAKPSGSGEKEQLFGENEPKTSGAPKDKNFENNLERVSQGRNADVPKDAKGKDAAAEKAPAGEKAVADQAPMKDPYDNPDYRPPAKPKGQAKGKKQ